MSPPVNRSRLLDRFLQYVRIATSADPHSEAYPSSPGQLELGRLAAEQLREMTLDDAHQDEYGLVWATVPATSDGPPIALVAHMDTSPEAPGRDVRPQVIEDYPGGDVRLPAGGQTIRVDQNPELDDLVGKTLVTSDGTTLLGGDDKAGVAIVMELALHLVENPHLPHGPVRILLTCDEEIGRGTDHIDLKKLDATAGYTLDGGGAGVIDVETFSADAATVLFTGRNIHPALAKDRMVNATRAAGEFLARLPRDREAPEVTDGRQGFVHPYAVEGGVGQARVDLILRSFETEQLAEYADRVRGIAGDVATELPGVNVEVDIRRQYRNLGDGLRKAPMVVDLAEQAYASLGRACTRTTIRGGTDGSLLTEMGLPTPNLASGQHNIHSPLEFVCLEEMIEAVEHLIELLRLWSERGRA